jgi:hypothetical protein
MNIHKTFYYKQLKFILHIKFYFNNSPLLDIIWNIKTINMVLEIYVSLA